MLELGVLGQASFRLLELGELGETSFRILELGELGETSFRILELVELGETNQFVSQKPFVMVSHNGCKLLRGKLWKTCKTAYFSRLMTPLKCFTMFHCCSSIYFTHCGKITIFVEKNSNLYHRI